VRATLRSAAIASVAEAAGRLSFCVADLTRDAGWDAAVAACDYVLHVASPLGGDAKDPGALIGPARDGTLRVLRAAARAGVKRVVLTSSTAATSPPLQSGDSVNDERVWTDPDDANVNAYRRSKVLAERAAWEIMAKHPGPTTLTTILPAAVFGPLLASERPGSAQIIQRLLSGRPPGIPRVGFCIVDVRDLAALHVRAMIAPEAAGERFIAAGDFLWMADIASALRARLGARAARVPTRVLPDALVRLIARFVPALRTITPGLGRRHVFSSAKAQRMLGFAPRPGVDAVLDCAESLIAGGAARMRAAT
jgi:nucleoside-diphosphate-sugar epimerase